MVDDRRKQYNRNMENFKKLEQFRSLFGRGVTDEESMRIWGKSYNEKPVKNENIYVNEKIGIAKENLKFLLIFKLVKFVGVSGSVGSGFAKEEDDIDLFIVVRNGTMWLYRALVQIRNIFFRKIRVKGDKNVKDKFCLNLIAEERGLAFDSDIFNFNELMYLVPIYNEKYINYVFSQNEWLITEYGVKKENLITNIKSEKEVNIFVRILNKFFYYLQLIYMKLASHQPDFKRLAENSKKGRIEFFPKGFKQKKIKNYLKEFMSTN